MTNNDREVSLLVLREIESSEDLGSLALPIISCITKAFGHSMPEDEVESALTGTLVVVAKNTDLVVGYASLHKKQIEEYKHASLDHIPKESHYYHLEAGVIDRDFQGQGIYSQLNRERIQEVIRHKANLLTTTTQNPKVEQGIVSSLNAFISEGVLKSFSIKRIKLEKYYGRQLTAYPLEVPPGPFKNLDMEAGDCYSLQFHLAY